MHEDLIARLEAATGPDQMLDAEIARHVGWTETEYAWLSPAQDARQDSPPRYTSSIDAALTLVPSDRYWIAASGRTRPDEPLGGASIYTADGASRLVAEAEATTPALALCIAALKARSAAHA